jgi:hypothetical protein
MVSTLDNISKIYMSPRAKWNCTQIFLRTIWTPLKDNKSYGHSATCLNCSHHTADTMHIYVHCLAAWRVWSKIEKILKMLNKLGMRSTLSPQQILFHKGCNDHATIGLLMVAKYAITLLMRKVASNPINRRVIDAFMKSNTLQLCETNIFLHKDTSTWSHLKTTIQYILNDMTDSGSRSSLLTWKHRLKVMKVSWSYLYEVAKP